MSARSASPTTDKLLGATVDLLWRQWRAIGGAAAGTPVRSQVDLEALCLGSLSLEVHEPRLWIVMNDWLRDASGLVSIQRLRNLKKSFDGTAEKLSELAHAVVRDAKDSRWRALVTGRKRAGLPEERAVKRRSSGAQIVSGPALQLRMRAAFGVGIKADLLAFLIGSDARATVATAAEALGYTTPPVFRALRDLNDAGFVRKWDGPSATEYLVMPQDWVTVLGGQDKLATWQHWSERVGYACAAIRCEHQAMGGRSVSDYALGVAMRDVMSPRKESLARALGVHTSIPDSAHITDWTTFHDLLARQSVERA